MVEVGVNPNSFIVFEVSSRFFSPLGTLNIPLVPNVSAVEEDIFKIEVSSGVWPSVFTVSKDKPVPALFTETFILFVPSISFVPNAVSSFWAIRSLKALISFEVFILLFSASVNSIVLLTPFKSKLIFLPVRLKETVFSKSAPVVASSPTITPPLGVSPLLI
ncbi:hypothetical protein SDC9_197719 [bioreactor metagenome]|uniref:Uncharacterized protein n=1 Tax=bioreactor metagenome TaxID=1076179 RepID=A0A645ISA9_9ZZZZ